MKTRIFRGLFISCLTIAFLSPLPALPQGSESSGGGPGKGGLMAPWPGMMPPTGIDGPGPCLMPPPPGIGGPVALMTHPNFASGPGIMPPPPDMGGPMIIDFESLDLSEDQQQKLADQKAITMDKAAPLMARLHFLQRQYRETLLQASVNIDQLSKIQSQLGEQKQALDAVFCNGAVASAQILTPEQRNLLRQKMNQLQLGIHHFRQPAEGK